MSTGPLRRATGTLGLLILVPIVVQLVSGAISVEEAALRALAVAVVTVAFGHLASSVVRSTLRRVESRTDGAAAVSGAHPAGPGSSNPAPTVADAGPVNT